MANMTGVLQEELWAITCYYNPVGYRTRQENYHVFRQHLQVPLLTVELSFDGRFQLEEGDTDRLIQVGGGDIMWQKERLLNIALSELPQQCQYVMWLDCELVFERQDLPEAIVAALQGNVLIQPFSRVYDLKRGIGLRDALEGNIDLRRDSMAWQISTGTFDSEETKTEMLDQYSPGHAWAVRRDAIDQCRFYDGMILGSGDFAMAMAALGRSEQIVRSYSMNKTQAEHYSCWSKHCHQAIQGRIGVVDGLVRHLWHGDLQNRGYSTRYALFEKFEFDPYKDIALTSQGCWQWSSDKPEMHDYVRKYFESRKEDG